VSDEEYDGPVIRFSINTDWDFRGYHSFEKVPAGWDEWDERERDNFLEETAREFRDAHAEFSFSVYDSPSAAVSETRDAMSYNAQFSPDRLENTYVND
jgi:hypothetical protein